MPLIAEETVLEVKHAIDIVEVVQAYFPLKKAGVNYKARCPFHEEKTASFNVNPERQIFKCFGCGKGGDAIAFVMDQEKVDYPDAVKVLAGRYGISVRYKEGSGSGSSPREELLAVLEWASRVYRQLLLTAPEAEAARRHLSGRGVKDETQEVFRLGYSPDTWDYLLSRARKAGHSDRSLLEAGLISRNESRMWDKFRGRLMFPIFDGLGKTIAFGARTLKDEQPKFLNSPETAVFSKGRTLYGLHFQKEAMGDSKVAHVVEGYMDVIVPFQAGVKGIVATLGTALTPDHVKVLRRYADRINLVFDADPAGRKASERGVNQLLSENVDIFVAKLPEGMDPDDVVLKAGPERLRSCLAEEATPLFPFLVDILKKRHGTATAAAKARIVDEMVATLSRLGSDTTKELLIQEFARHMDMPEASIRAAVFGNEKTARENVERTVKADEARAMRLLGCAIADPEAARYVQTAVPAEKYPTEALRSVAAVAYRLLDEKGAIEARALLALVCDRDASQAAADIVNLGVEPGQALSIARACTGFAECIEARGEMARLANEILHAAPGGEDDLLRRTMEAKRKNPVDRGHAPDLR